MSAYMKLGDIQGEATDQDHKGWILLNSMASPVHRTIPPGAKDQQRTKGDTVLGDINISRQLDKSSVKLAEACAKGNFFKEVEIHFCTMIRGRQEPYLTYKLANVIVTSYGFHGVASGQPLPSEDITLGFTEVEWTYVVVDPDTGDKKGNVQGRYSLPGQG